MSIKTGNCFDGFGFILKEVDTKNKVIASTSNASQALSKYKNHILEKDIFVAIYEQWKEIQIYEKSDNEERKLLAPISAYDIDKYNCPRIIMPKFTPIIEDKENLDPDEVFFKIFTFMSLLGYDDYEIGKFLNEIYDFCVKYDLVNTNILESLGYHPTYGVCIMSYGITNELKEIIS